MTTEAAVQWLVRMRDQLHAAQQIENASRARLAPDFRALSYMRTDEYGMSCILADLLDPSGAHGQGHVFLASFLKHFWPEPQIEADGATVVLESLTDRIENGRRRLDIRVQFPGGGVFGIENKVRDAIDQDKQVVDYLDDLAQRDASHRLIYLTSSDSQMPGVNSIGIAARDQAIRDGRLRMLGLPSLLPWLRTCIGLCEATRVRTFIDELILYIQSEFLGIGNMTEHNLVIEAAMRSADDARTALQIAAAQDAIKKRLFERFKRDLRSTMEQETAWLGWSIDSTDDLMTTFGSIYVMPPYKSRYNLRLSFERPGGNLVYFGISTRSRKGEDDCEAVHEKVKGVLAAGRCSKPYWVWYQRFSPYNDWGTSPDAMSAIMREGSSGMAFHVMKAFEELRNGLANAPANVLA